MNVSARTVSGVCARSFPQGLCQKCELLSAPRARFAILLERGSTPQALGVRRRAEGSPSAIQSVSLPGAAWPVALVSVSRRRCMRWRRSLNCSGPIKKPKRKRR